MTQLPLEESPADLWSGPAGDPLAVITAYGTPAPQGALSHGAGGGAYYTNAKQLTPWRNAVRDAAMALLGTHEHKPPTKEKKGRSGPCKTCGIPRRAHGLYGGALAVLMVVTVDPPLKPPALPATRSSGDWDHHGRAVGDALTQASVWRDDAQVVDGRVRMFYPGHPIALDRPGALIYVWRAL